MTDEEIEQKIAAEVDRRIGGMVGQIGKDLADRYATKDDVDKAIEARIRREAQALNIALLDIVNRLKKDEKVPDTHPLAVVFQIMEEISDLEMRVMELGIFIVATQQMEDIEYSSEKPPLERMQKLTVLKQFMAEREHGRILDKTENVDKLNNDNAQQLVLQFTEILGPRPKGTE